MADEKEEDSIKQPLLSREYQGFDTVDCRRRPSLALIRQKVFRLGQSMSHCLVFVSPQCANNEILDDKYVTCDCLLF
jgi:hypothetical protein